MKSIIQAYIEMLSESSHNIDLRKTTIPHDMLNLARNDPNLGDVVGGESSERFGIFSNQNLVGFMSPRKDGNWWRTGAIFIHPDFRNQGIGSKAIQKFFSDKESGLALVEPHNISSRKAYERAGFNVLKRSEYPDRDGNISSYDVMVMKRK